MPLLPLLLVALAAVVSAAPTIYPTPRQVEVGAGSVALDRSAHVAFAAAEDAPTAALLRDLLADTRPGAAKLAIRVGWRGQPGIDAHLDGIPAVTGAYRLKVAPDGIVIAGHDARGAFYGARTLASLVASSRTLAPTVVSDWPEVAFRGVVEGFYGTPWSHERRLSLIRFMGETKLDTYIYGPKDDPFHSSPNWRKPYPAAEAARIHELVEACRAQHVDFVWAVHPGKDIRWNDADFAAVLAKFEAMHALGVRGFSVFFDDISGEGTKADQQARLLNFLHERFVKAKGDVLPLILCPTQYNRSWSGGDYLDVLGRELDPSIQVMWTGDRVVADLDRQAMEWINRRLRRKAFIWWNFPVSDYVRNHLLLGPTYGNATDIGPLYGGFVSNPMERSEASKVALFGLADYTWNPLAYRPDAAWRAGIAAVVPRAAQAYTTFSAHNSDLGPNGHGYNREESVAFAPVAEAALAELRAGKVPSGAVRAELMAIASAPAAIRPALPPLHLEEVGDWLDAFEALGRAGVASLDGLAALQRGQPAAAWPLVADANAQLARMAEIDATKNRNPYQPGIRTGTKVVTPLVREVAQVADARLIAALGGRPPIRPRPIVSTPEGAQSLEKMVDGKEDGYAYLRRLQVAGDWVGIDLGSPQPVQRLRLIQGRSDGDHDRVHDGVLEGLGADGKWREIRKVSESRTEITLPAPQIFSQVRVRVLKPGVPGGKPDLWTAIREFEVNPVDATKMRSTVAALGALPVRLADGEFTMSPGYEVHALPAGGQIGLLLPAVSEVREVEVDLAAETKGLILEGSPDGEAWKAIAAKTEGTRLKAKVGAPLRAVRVRNAGAAALQVTPKAFIVRTKPQPPTPQENLRDGVAATLAELAPGVPALELPLPKGARGATFLVGAGTLVAAVKVGGKEVPLALPSGQVPTVSLPAGAEALLLRASGNSPAKVHEVVVR